jgi:hypothetical protein
MGRGGIVKKKNYFDSTSSERLIEYDTADCACARAVRNKIEHRIIENTEFKNITLVMKNIFFLNAAK